jgi:endonuclease YncB( thermonuclease family)
LAGIDAPERKQPFGRKSKQYLAAQIAGQEVSVDWHKLDRYHRIVGKIIHDGKDVDLAMVRAGVGLVVSPLCPRAESSRPAAV